MTEWRAARIFCWGFIVSEAIMVILILVSIFVMHGYNRDTFWSLMSSAGAALWMLTVGVGGNLLIPTFRRRSDLYQAAITRQIDRVSLVREQPNPSVVIPSLPIAIESMQRRRVVLGWYGCIYATIVSPFLAIQFIASQIAPDGIFMATFLGLLTLVFLGLGIFVLIRPSLLTIQATEEGLTVRSTESRTMRWKDVRAFAIVGGFHRPGTSKTYMLSSGKNRIRWTRLARTRWCSINAPATSDDDFQRQMDALLSYIAARTGLPLLDLR